MKKMITRIAACSLAVLLAFNTVAIPKSKAVVAETATATSVLAAYLAATGMPLMVIEGGASAASAGAASMISGYAAATGTTSAAVSSGVAAGVTIGTGGAIIIGVAAAALLAGIAAWAISEYGAKPGADPVPVYDVPSEGFSYADGTYKTFSQIVYTSGEPYVIVGSHMPNRSGTLISNDSIDAKYLQMSYSSLSGEWLTGLQWIDAPSNTVKYFLELTNRPRYIIRDSVYRKWMFVTLREDDLGYYRISSTEEYSFEEYPWIDEFFNIQPANVTIAPEPDYAPLPELAPTEQIELAPVLDPNIAPDDVPDAIFQQLANGNLQVTHSITTNPDPGTNPDPDPDPDPEPDPEPDPGLDSGESIGWLRRIALACEAVADKILGGIQSLFAPDPALMTEVANTFSSKFGFMSELHALGADLLNVGVDTEPPVVYIHLEDAEGTIDYGGTVKALDMSWYERYKPDGDRIIGGFLWLGFLWLLFKRASAIINGAEMQERYSIDIENGHRGGGRKS